jgi:hypothetical protein
VVLKWEHLMGLRWWWIERSEGDDVGVSAPSSRLVLIRYEQYRPEEVAKGAVRRILRRRRRDPLVVTSARQVHDGRPHRRDVVERIDL